MEALSWSFGLINHAGKFLTAESFGCRINCSSSVMKKKQILFLEPAATEGKIYLKTHLGRYLTCDSKGEFRGDSESAGKDEELSIEAQPDGRWALKGAHGYYAGGTGEALTAYTKTIDEDRLWIVKLAMHPQVAIKNVNRKRYMNLAADGNTLNTDIILPWGEGALITLHFFDEGKYGLMASNGFFLGANGQLKQVPDANSKFILEFYGGQLAFKAANGQYLSALGGPGSVKAAKDAVTKDELWVMEDSQPQLKLTAVNGKKVSIKAGVEVTANQAESNATEFFLIEINKDTKQWSFRSNNDKFWSCGGDGGIQAIADERKAGEWFSLEWHGPALVIKAANGKYVTIKKNGSLIAAADSPNDETSFVYEIINRPKLVLRGEHGFIGTLPSGLLECNKSSPEEYNMHVKKGVCEISGQNGKYWKVGPHGITCTGDSPDNMTLEFVEYSKFAIRFGDKYLQGAQNGGFQATGTKIDASTLWEY